MIEYTDLDPGMTVSKNSIILRMTPEETAKFTASYDSFALVQINLLREGKRAASRQLKIPVRPNLKTEVM